MVTGGGTVSPAGVPGPGVIASNAPGCVTTASPTPGPDTAGLPPQRRATESRRSNKPIMEKRRRARINNCLNELKTLILDAMKKDPARHTKLEKADILEMTVKHLENLQRQQVAMSAATDPNVLNKFRAGFSECAGEVGRFPGLDSPVRRRLLQHLANCLNGATTTTTSTSTTSTTSGTTAPQATPPEPVPSQHQTAVQVHIHPTSTATPTVDAHQTATPVSSSSNGIFFTTGANGAGLQLVPTRLPNGDIALVLPATGSGTAQIFRQTATITTASPASSPAPSSSSCSPLPMLIPIPMRTSSTASASSWTSSCASTSPLAFERLRVNSPSHTSAANPPVCRDMATSPTAYHLPVSPATGNNSNGGYNTMDLRPYSPPLQKPLALVVKKETAPEVPSVEEKPWRPW